MGRKRIKPNIEKIPGYTEKQSQFLRGEVTPDEVDGRFYRLLLKSATAINDTETIALAADLLAYSKEEAMKHNLERIRIRRKKKREGILIEYRQPKTTEYTEHQKKIIRDEIPIENVHANELISIMQKAKLVGDTELVDLVSSIFKERQEDSLEKKENRLLQLRERYDGKSDFFDSSRTTLTKNEIDMLQSKVDDSECTLEHLYHIRDVAKLNNDEKNLKLAELFIQYKTHPETVYRTQDKNEAMENIERILGIPIRRPKDWFTE